MTKNYEPQGLWGETINGTRNISPQYGSTMGTRAVGRSGCRSSGGYSKPKMIMPIVVSAPRISNSKLTVNILVKAVHSNPVGI